MLATDGALTSLLSIKETADFLKVPVKTIYYWVYRREIPHLKIGRHLRFEIQKVLTFFAEKTEEMRGSACSHPLQRLQSLPERRSLTIRQEALLKRKE